MYEWVLFANLAVYLVVLAYYLRSPCASAFHPATFYAAIHGFVFVLRPIIAWQGGYMKVYTVYRFVPTMDVKIVTICIVALAYVTVMFSVMYWAPKPVVTLEIPSDIRQKLKKPILATCAVLAPVSFYALLKSWNSRAYDLDTMVMTAGGYRINTTGVGYLTEAPNMMITLSLLLAWVYRFRLISLAPFFAFVILKAGSGGRGSFVIAGGAMGMLYLYENRRKWPTPRILGLFAVVLMLFAAVGKDRGYAIRGLFIEDQVKVSESSASALLDSMDYGNLEYVEFMVRTVPDLTQTYGYFLDNLQILTEPIPRALWSGKPVGPPIKMWDLWNYGRPLGLTPGVAGYAWSQLGWLGVMLYSVFVGFCLAKVYNLFMRYRYAPLVVVGYFCFLAGTIVYLRDGVLLTTFRSQLFNIIPLVIVYLASMKVHRRVRLLGMLGPVRYKAFVAERIAEFQRKRQAAAMSGLRGR